MLIQGRAGWGDRQRRTEPRLSRRQKEERREDRTEHRQEKPLRGQTRLGAAEVDQVKPAVLSRSHSSPAGLRDNPEQRQSWVRRHRNWDDGPTNMNERPITSPETRPGFTTKAFCPPSHSPRFYHSAHPGSPSNGPRNTSGPQQRGLPARHRSVPGTATPSPGGRRREASKEQREKVTTSSKSEGAEFKSKLSSLKENASVCSPFWRLAQPSAREAPCAPSKDLTNNLGVSRKKGSPA